MKSNYFGEHYPRNERLVPWHFTRPEEERLATKTRGLRYRLDGSNLEDNGTFPAELRGAYYPKVPPLHPHRSKNTNRYAEHDYSKSSWKGANYDLPNDVWERSSPLRNYSIPEYRGRAQGTSYRDHNDYGYRQYGQNRRPEDDERLNFIPRIPDGLERSSFRANNRDNPLTNRDAIGFDSNAGNYHERGGFSDPNYQQPRTLRGRSSSVNRAVQSDFNDHTQRPHSLETLPVGHRDKLDRDRAVGLESPWGDVELWNSQHVKRYNSLPSLSFHGNQFEPVLHIPYNGYRGEFPPGDERLRGHHRGLWEDTSHQDLMSLRFLADPKNAESFIERFLESCIKDNLVLDVAAEVLVEARELQDVIDRTSYPVTLAAKDVLHDCINEELVAIARDERQNAVIRYWKDIANDTELMESVRDLFVTETLQSELKLVAADAIGEMVEDYFREKEVVTAFGILYDEVSEHLLYGTVKDALHDLSLDALCEELLDEEVREVASIFVTDIYATGSLRMSLSSRQADAENNEVYKKSAEYVSDVLLLESLVNNLTFQNQRWTDAEHKERALDGLIFDQLLSQSLKIDDAVEKVQHNTPIKQFHDDTVDETGMQFLLDQMTPSLDDEMAKQDQVEVELAGLLETPPTSPGIPQQ